MTEERVRGEFSPDDGRTGLRYVVSGSRIWSPSGQRVIRSIIQRWVVGLPADTVIVHGGARGVDTWVQQTAELYELKTEIYYPDWKKHGKAAGVIRNQQMINTKPDRVAIFWNGTSRGTKDMIDRALKAGISVEVPLTGDVLHPPETIT